MKSVIGKNITYTLYGESHGAAIGIVIDGLPAGIHIDLEQLQTMMNLRKAKGKISTQRHEGDEVKFISGLFQGYTTGTPLHLQIENTNTRSKDYHPELLRPSHADYVAYEKYHGYQDYRGGGHFSGRLTAPIVAAGAIAMQILKQKEIQIGTHIKQCMNIIDDDFQDYPYDLNQLSKSEIAMLNEEKKNQLIQLVEQAALNSDSLGAVLETAIINLPKGIGEPFFHSVESELSRYLFSIPAVKGIEFGLGFEFAKHYGSEVNDRLISQNGEIKTETNHNAGINGGITNGMPIIFKTVIKPTPSIFQTQKTVNYETKENCEITIQGRHDPAIFHRARIVIDAMCAMCILDLLVERYGCEGLVE